MTESIYEYLKVHKHEWDIFEMHALPKSTCEAERLPTLFQKEGDYKTIQKEDQHFYIPIETSWEIYYKNLSKNLRHNLKRRLKRAEELGTVVHQRFRGQDLKWAHFLTIFKINERGNFPELYKSEKNRSFHKLLYETMKDQGWVQIEVLYINDEPVAFQYGFHYNKKYQDWRGGFDSKYEALGTGKILMRYSIENWFREQVREIDFLRGTHAYKADWQPHKRDFVDLRIFRMQKLESLIAYIWLNNLKPIFKNRNPKSLKT